MTKWWGARIIWEYSTKHEDIGGRIHTELLMCYYREPGVFESAERAVSWGKVGRWWAFFVYLLLACSSE